ncbi:MAG: hypothetical protein IR158_19095 [Cellulomonas sp.]|uniref:GNAT family N-acetyltransferase n=1 Tax=Cellulomonas sp. TaxID=40001 RepID=UPI001A015F43|nr:GNAT family N-acetyltransferase [Cellulomonas sp.]MBF0689867.1 hypothetical protein [Cellulomonas sp.]
MLRWSSARAEHKVALTQFICTDPAKKQYEKHRGKHHPKPWELEVQSHLRGLRVPVSADEALLLGFDGEGLAATAHFGLDDTNQQFMIWAVACAQRTRGQHLGREALTVALDLMSRTKARYELDCGVFTHVDPRNVASRKMCVDAGFEFLGTYEGYESYVRDL